MSNTQVTGRHTLAEQVCLASTHQLLMGWLQRQAQQRAPRAGTCSGVRKAHQHRSRGTGYVIKRIHTLLATGSCLKRMGSWNRKSVQNPQDSRGWKSIPSETQSANEERDKRLMISKYATADSRNTAFFTFCLAHWCPSCSGCPCILPELWKVLAECMDKQYSWTSLWPFPWHDALGISIVLRWCPQQPCGLIIITPLHFSSGDFLPNQSMYASPSCWSAFPYHW